jgi:hypothetical protein
MITDEVFVNRITVLWIYFFLTPQNELLNMVLIEGKLSDSETYMNKCTVGNVISGHTDIRKFISLLVG